MVLVVSLKVAKHDGGGVIKGARDDGCYVINRSKAVLRLGSMSILKMTQNVRRVLTDQQRGYG